MTFPCRLAGLLLTMWLGSTFASPEVRILGSDQPPEIAPVLVASHTPEYPREAIRAEIGGLATACFTITRKGRVRDVVVVQSSNELFRKPVIKAIRKSRYTPAKHNGKPVAAQLCRSYRFSLEER